MDQHAEAVAVSREDAEEFIPLRDLDTEDLWERWEVLACDLMAMPDAHPGRDTVNAEHEAVTAELSRREKDAKQVLSLRRDLDLDGGGA